MHARADRQLPKVSSELPSAILNRPWGAGHGRLKVSARVAAAGPPERHGLHHAFAGGTLGEHAGIIQFHSDLSKFTDRRQFELLGYHANSCSFTTLTIFLQNSEEH